MFKKCQESSKLDYITREGTQKELSLFSTCMEEQMSKEKNDYPTSRELLKHALHYKWSTDT
jgi:hypothetical protein